MTLDPFLTPTLTPTLTSTPTLSLTQVSELVRYLSESLPALAIKTGYCDKTRMGTKFANNLNVCADLVQSGTPTLLLDVRAREPIT